MPSSARLSGQINRFIMPEEQKPEAGRVEEKRKEQITYKIPLTPRTNPPGIGTWVGFNFYDLR